MSCQHPISVAVDASGNVYIAEQFGNRIRKVGTDGVISTVAGGNGGYGFNGDGGAATSTNLNYPSGVAVDAVGNIYIADQNNQRIRKVNSNGIISTVAGNGTQGFSGDGGAATSAQLNSPSGVTVDAAGNIYIADQFNNRIRKVNSSGVISTVAGNGTQGFSGDGGAATSAQLYSSGGVAVDAAGNIYIADNGNNVIRKVNTNGIISTIAGNGTQGFSGDGGAATSANLSYPTGLEVDASGNIYIAEGSTNRIRKVNSSGIISTIAGNGIIGFSGDGGVATSANLYNPTGVAVDVSGNIYIADENNKRVREVIFPPVIASFTPTAAAIGTTVTIIGTGFTGATAVSFGGVAATTFTVASSTSITAVVPNNALSGDISVTSAGGTGSLAGFLVVPTITSFTPTTASTGTTVTITGTNFTNATTVSFGGVAATTFNVVSAASITAVVPNGAISGSISVTTTAGTGSLAGFVP